MKQTDMDIDITSQPRYSTIIASALNQLSGLDNSEKLREDAIRNGKAIIDNWNPPTDDQLDKIFFKMKEEFLDAI